MRCAHGAAFGFEADSFLLMLETRHALAQAFGSSIQQRFAGNDAYLSRIETSLPPCADEGVPPGARREELAGQAEREGIEVADAMWVDWGVSRACRFWDTSAGRFEGK